MDITRKEFELHCKENQETSQQLDKLMWLADPEMKQALKEIVENQKSMTNVGKRVIKVVGYLSAIIGLLYLMFKFISEIRHH